MQVEGTRMYRVRDVAQHFDVSVATIYRAIESGQLDAVKLGTGKGMLRVTGAAMAAYAQANTQDATDSSVAGATSAAATDQDLTAESTGACHTQSARSPTHHH